MRFLVTTISCVWAIFALYTDLALAAPASLDTSTVETSTVSNTQRKTFFDTENEYHWAFYYNGTAIEYSYSADGEVWTSAGTLPYNTSSFSVIFRVVDATAYAFLVTEANSYDIVLRRATLGEGTINFDAAQTVFDGDITTSQFTKPTVAVSENDTLWVSTIRNLFGGNVARYQVFARHSSNDADGDLSAFAAATAVGAATTTLQSAIIMPQNGDAMSLISAMGGSNVVGYTFDGSNWSSANSGGDYSWFDFPASGINNHLGTVEIFSIVADGSDIYIGGSFTAIQGNRDMAYVAHWDGSSWQPMKTGLSSYPNSMVVHGDDLYVGGAFVNAGGNAAADYVARWDGTDWFPVKVGPGGTVYALAISGDDLYVGGNFTNADGNAAIDRIARWDITDATWNPLGGDGAINNNVRAIAVDGSNVFVGGQFTNADGNAAADYVARWDGAAWNAMGTGTNAAVYAFAISGSDVYVGGDFTTANGVTSAGVARWDGAAWNVVGGLSTVRTLAFYGGNLYAGGGFANAGGANGDRIVYRSGGVWNALGLGLNNSVNAIANCGSSLCVAGLFAPQDNVANAEKIARWDGSSWSGLSSGGFNHGTVLAITTFQNDVYIGGTFLDVGGFPDADHIARWDGTKWNEVTTLSPAFGGGIAVEAFAVIGSDLYIGGAFANMGGVATADHIARWDGTTIYGLASGFNSNAGRVRALTVDSNGILYAGGDFNAATGVANTAKVASWNGTTWSPLNTGLGGSVYALAASGTNVYVGGLFADADGNAAADNIALWDGAAWNAMGTGVNGQVYAIAIIGSDVYVGGTFTDVSAIAAADKLARWNGSAWYAVGAGLVSGGQVNTLAVSGTNLYVGGTFSDAGGNAAADRVALWDGTSWQGLGQTGGNVGVVGIVGDSLYVGGTYMTAPGVDDWRTLLVYAPAVANDADSSSEISSASDADGNVFLAYTNDTGNLKFRAYDAADEEWAATVTINAAASTSPNLSLNPTTGDLLATWIDSGGITYVGAETPYEAADWGTQEVLYNTGTNVGVTAPQLQVTEDLMVVWTNGVGSPYQIYADLTAYGPSSVVISSVEANPTNVSPITVDIEFEEDVTGFVVGDITVVNGTKSNFVAVDGNSYTLDITPTADGTITVDIPVGVAEDAVGHDNLAATQFSIIYDSTSPTLVISSSESSPTNNSPFSVTFEFDEDVTGFVVGDITVSNGSAGNFAAVDADTYTADITPTAHGVVTVDVAASRAIDAAGNGNDAATQFAMNYDIVNPTVAISTSSTDPTNDSPFVAEIEFSENVSGLVLGEITVGNGTASSLVAIDGNSYTANITPTTDGVVTVDIAGSVATDAAGNDNDAAAQFALTYDNTPPVVTITDPVDAAVAQVNVTAFLIDGTCSENGRVVTIGAVSTGGGATVSDTPNCLAGAWSTTLDLSSLADGEVTFSADQQDQVGLDAITVTRERTKDVVSPIATISSSENTPSKTTPFSISIALSEAVAGFAIEDLIVGNGVAANFVALDAVTYTADITASGQGAVSIDIAVASFQDLVGNQNIASAQYGLTHDSVAPSVMVTSSEANPTEANVIPISIAFSEAVTGFSVGDVQVANATLSNFSVVSSQLYRANLRPTASGAVIVNIAANAGIDAALNGNTAAPQFSITYENPEGEFQTTCSIWNGFFSGEERLVWNILEHVNAGTRSFGIETKLYSMTGVEQSSLKFSIDPGKQLDLLVHDMPGWTSDSYGLVCSTFANDEAVTLDGRMVTYKRKPTGGFEYVFASPLTDGYAGRQFVNYNTYQPSLNPKDSNNFMANWIQVTNLDVAEQSGRLLFYGQDGKLIKQRKLRIRGRGQQDVSAHDWDFPTVGYVEWIPSNSEAKFMLNNTRYLYDNAELENRFEGVLLVRASQGNQSNLHGIIDTADASSILELSNINDEEIGITLKVVNSAGEELQTLSTTMLAHETRHIIMDSILGGDLGRVSIATPGIGDNAITATVFQYGRTAEGSVSYLYGAAPLSALGQKSLSSYNTYVGQDCDLYLSNISNDPQTVEVSLQRNDGQQVLSANSVLLEAKQTIVSNICAIESGESYGVVTVESENPGVINASLIRKDRNDGFRYPITVR